MGTNAIDQSIIIVSGLPRSGTSMMMQMLSGGGLPLLTDALRGADADNPRGYYEFEPVRRTRRDHKWLDDAVGKAVKVIHLLLLDLPTDRRYRVILMRRDVQEVIQSQAAMLARAGRQGAALSPARLAEVFARQMRDVTDYLARQACFDVFDVSYESAVDDPQATAIAVDRFLGGRLDCDAMAATVDPSLYRQKR
jgi:hypothetical protein